MLLTDYGKHRHAARGPSSATTSGRHTTIPKSLGHHAEWIHACKTGAATTCNFEYAGWLTEANHPAGNVAYRASKRLEWDPVSAPRDECPRANPFTRRSYRRGWSLGS